MFALLTIALAEESCSDFTACYRCVKGLSQSGCSWQRKRYWKDGKVGGKIMETGVCDPSDKMEMSREDNYVHSIYNCPGPIPAQCHTLMSCASCAKESHCAWAPERINR